ncbi:unnamed protein product [Sphagnum troendelagicum]
MAAATDDVPDVAAAVAAVVVEERVTTVLATSGTESEKETVEVESTSIIQVEKKISKEKKRVNPPREKKAKSSLPNQEDREKKKQLKKLAPKEKKPKKMPKAANGPAAAHPSYLLMVKEAIGTLKERTGSSQYAIAKYLEDMYKTGLPPNFKKILSIQLRNMTKQGKVYKVKNSFKLSDELKKPVKAPKAAMAIKDSSKEIKAYKPTKVAKKDSSRVKSKTANGALSKAVKLGGGAVVAKPTKVPKAPKSVKHVAVKPPRKAPVAASKSKDEEKVTAPSAARKPAASLTSKPTAVKKTASKKKVGTPRKAPKSVKSAKSKSSKSAVIPGKISKTVASPAKRAKK